MFTRPCKGFSKLSKVFLPIMTTLSIVACVNYPPTAKPMCWASCFTDSTNVDISTGSSDNSCPEKSLRANFFIFLAANKSRSLTCPQLLHSQTLSDSVSSLFIDPHSQVFELGSKRPIRSMFTPYHSALNPPYFQ